MIDLNNVFHFHSLTVYLGGRNNVDQFCEYEWDVCPLITNSVYFLFILFISLSLFLHCDILFKLEKRIS